MNGNGGMSTKLPVFDGKNWNRWMKQMIVLFGAQDVLELVTEGYVPVAADATDAQKLAQKDTKKKDQRALFYIHQCVDENVFEKIADSETAKAAWDTLIRCYGGDASVKKVKLQSLRKQYENLNMKNNEKVPVTPRFSKPKKGHYFFFFLKHETDCAENILQEPALFIQQN